MASDGSVARRIAVAIQTIKDRGEALAGGRQLTMPTHSRYGQTYLRVLQLEAIAAFLSGVEAPKREDITPSEVNYDLASFNDLKMEVKSRGLPVNRTQKKPDLVALLKQNDLEMAANKAAGELPHAEIPG